MLGVTMTKRFEITKGSGTIPDLGLQFYSIQWLIRKNYVKMYVSSNFLLGLKSAMKNLLYCSID